MMNTTSHPAPEFEVSAWLNAPGPVTLAAQRGKVVAVYAFQMLCPGCVSHAIPQAKNVQGIRRSAVAFEHNERDAFIEQTRYEICSDESRSAGHERCLSFPIKRHNMQLPNLPRSAVLPDLV